MSDKKHPDAREILQVVNSYVEIADAQVVYRDDAETFVLLLQMAPGVRLSEQLERDLKMKIRIRVGVRSLPNQILEKSEICRRRCENQTCGNSTTRCHAIAWEF